MTTISLHINLHQPYVLKEVGILNIDNHTDYANFEKTEEEVNKLADNCVLPLNKILLEKIKKAKGRFKFSLSITGTTLEVFQQYRNDVLNSFKKILQTGSVQILSQSFYHSHASAFSSEEYQEQVNQFGDYVYSLFRIYPVDTKNNHFDLPLNCKKNCRGKCGKQKTMTIFVDYHVMRTKNELQAFSQKLDVMLSSREFQFSFGPSMADVAEEEKNKIIGSSLLQRIYRIANLVRSSNDQLLIKWWRHLQDISYYGINSHYAADEVYIRNVLASMEVILIKHHLANRKYTSNQHSFLL